MAAGSGAGVVLLPAVDRARPTSRCLSDGSRNYYFEGSELKKLDEALAVAERGRTRAFADLLVERQMGQQDSDPYSSVTMDQILEMVNSQRGLMLYYSLAAGYLYSWLLATGAGILKFHEHYLGDNAVESCSDFQAGGSVILPTATSSVLELHITSVREALGVESYYSR
ncbi:Tetratricopeptide repeat protein 28 [Fukomys damarensis]|uniref:Tetratricopeptide repeat protein 28 n=1 Tax=Fukomys damarensis TaxID=885580 RepID=A0A091DKU2_FUKDA|nr:Tetratricopeptide repeat protein 28 [Fukomys damarensis]